MTQDCQSPFQPAWMDDWIPIQNGDMLCAPQVHFRSNEVLILQEITRASYLGVLCSHCNARIPVPKKTAVFCEELKHGEASDNQESKSLAFTSDVRRVMRRACMELKRFGNSTRHRESERRGPKPLRRRPWRCTAALCQYRKRGVLGLYFSGNATNEGLKSTQDRTPLEGEPAICFTSDGSALLVKNSDK